jgi:antagonist of KipI
MVARVVQQGWQSILVDAGRVGYGAFGVGTSGPMDALAFQVANALAGNDRNTVALEVAFGGLSLDIMSPSLMAVSGFAELFLDEVPVPSHRPFNVREGQRLCIRKSLQGNYAYLAVAGGFKANQWLGSCTTDLKVGLGGYQGRALMKDDVLQTNAGLSAKQLTMMNRLSHRTHPYPPWALPNGDFYAAHRPIRMIPGPEYSFLNASSVALLEEASFLLSARFNRMGYALIGPKIEMPLQEEMLSSAVFPGTLQCTPDGSLFLLMADAQTTGGYPRPGIVLSADLPRCAQLKPGNRFSFEWVSLPEAQYIERVFRSDLSVRIRSIQYQYL